MGALLLGLGVASFVSIKSVNHHIRSEYSGKSLPSGTNMQMVRERERESSTEMEAVRA